MAATFLLEIATPDRLLLHEQVTEAQIPAANGYLGILADHAPLLGELGTGELTYVADGRTRSMSITGGWVDVLPAHVRVLAGSAEKADEIDVKRARESLKRAESRLANPPPDLDVARALNALRRAQARIQCASHK